MCYSFRSTNGLESFVERPFNRLFNRLVEYKRQKRYSSQAKLSFVSPNQIVAKNQIDSSDA